MNEHAILGQLVLGHSLMLDRERRVVATRLTVFPERRDASPDPAALLRELLEVWPATGDAAASPGAMPTLGAASPAADEGPVTLTLREVAPAAHAADPSGSKPRLVPAAATRPAAGSPILGGPTAATPLSLNIASEPWLRALLTLRPPPHLMIEVPAFMTGDDATAGVLQALHAAGSVLIIKGRPLTELRRDLLPCFRHSLIDLGEERRSAGEAPPAGVERRITLIQSGVATRADVDAAFARGAVAVLGWPIDDALPPSAPGKASGKGVGPDLQIVMQLMQRVDREEPIDRLEAVLRNDPQLAFRLLRYLNSAAFGLQVEITSFRHALMMLGYKKLRRWLALLLASASPDPALRPAIHAAVRRGLLMEELGGTSADAEMRSEMFICGVFSLLDRMLGQPLATLFQSLPVPERVRQALVDGTGSYAPFLTLARAVETGLRTDILEAAEQCFVTLEEVNAALLRALRGARELDLT
ncbi:MAG: HDOD domain-containing protein [Rhodoferax sp.]|jgi:EAL and modified HD-GYP domain-containing signal transduction protein|nr:HDOD domain-containing protein [Rhodoferax sp.]MCL4737926.1 HDOD domain-containing protein [Burkholderiaceae bacterium]MCP5288615.1 HDOD domain-containing protein [Burkholderiaceae bacterium]